MRFLRDMLHHAYYWKERKPDAGPGPVQLYVKAWGRRADTAVIAVVDGFPVGAAWYRLFKASAARSTALSTSGRPSSRSQSSPMPVARASAVR